MNKGFTEFKYVHFGKVSNKVEDEEEILNIMAPITATVCRVFKHWYIDEKAFIIVTILQSIYKV